MIKVCAWCNESLGSVTSCDDVPDTITYGVCEVCLAGLLPEEKEQLAVFIDSLLEPVVVVDPGGVVVTANSRALQIMGKEAPDVEGCAGGDVFECAFAALPQGCGKTEHCSGCTIRNTVMDTFLSGRSHVKDPAYLMRGDPRKPYQLDLTISTEKVNEIVFLRIDRVTPQEHAGDR